ncbi:hypothetical protein Bbelb_240240 [Branchiostoma belcheri]|nr:hypothetical protein Bbelb_240240 [Branchiostoma belcheri]
MENETDGSPVEDGMNHVLSIGSTSRNLQTAYLIISLVLSVGCGLLLIFLVWKKEYLQKPSYYLRCNLAVDDIIFTGCQIPVRVYALFRQDASGRQVWCAAEGLVGPASLMSMCGTYLMMAVDLYYFVCDPLHYHDKVTTKRVVLGILVFRAFSILFGMAPLAFIGQNYSRCEMEPASSTPVATIFMIMNLLFVVLVVVSVPVIYCRVMLEARRQQERDENRDLWLFQTKAFKVMLPHAIVWAASITTTAFHIATVPALNSEEQTSQPALIIAARVALLLYLTLSSMANPVIYSFRLPEFRRACRELCGWRTNANPPAVPARRHRQDDVEMIAITGTGRRGAPVSKVAPAQTSSEGLIHQSTMLSDQAPKQTTQVDMIPGPGHRGRETTAGRPVRLTVMAEVHDEPPPCPGEDDIPTLTLDTDTDGATTGHILDNPHPRTKIAWDCTCKTEDTLDAKLVSGRYQFPSAAKTPSPAGLNHRYGETSLGGVWLALSRAGQTPRDQLPRSGNLDRRAKGAWLREENG